MEIHFEDEELRTLEIDLSGAPTRIQRAAPGVLKTKVGPLLKREMKRDARGHRHLPHLANAVTWEMIDTWTVECGLGPDGNQGSLAHIIVYGSVNNAPVYDHGAALRRATPRATEWLADVAEDAVLG